MNKSRRAVLVIGEAADKRIRQLCLAEPYPNSHEVYLTIEFDDKTEILIEVGCSSSFGITHLARDTYGELEPVKEPIHGSIRSLMKSRR